MTYDSCDINKNSESLCREEGTVERIDERSVRDRTTFQAGSKTKNSRLDQFISIYVDLEISSMRSAAVFKLLADPTRLRLLRVLSHDRFNVSELTSILGVAQSGVSRHLGLLKEANLVAEERAAGFVFYRLPDASGTEPRLPLWSLLTEQFAASTTDR